jgi:hypothetical protein
LKRYDIFNGDADGICALHQLRMADPAAGALVTGVKRDIKLLDRVAAEAGDRLTVLDISLDSNRAALDKALAAGAQVRWFDHHYAGELPKHAGLEAHIDTSAEVCTSLLVDRYLKGRFRPWAIVAAFGDGLPAVGWKLASAIGLNESNTMALAWLGECLNYNAYGETVADLLFPPDRLYRAVHEFAQPLAFVRESPAFTRLDAGFREDMAKAQALRPHLETAHGAVLVLPDEAWARRAIGVYANQLAQANPQRAHALLSPNSGGGYTVSVRAPVARPSGADALCRQFATGGGRTGAAGINNLPEADFERFVKAFGAAFHP